MATHSGPVTARTMSLCWLVNTVIHCRTLYAFSMYRITLTCSIPSLHHCP